MKSLASRVLALSFLSLVFSIAAKADGLPFPGFTYAYTDLVVAAQDDFPEYRFFFVTLRDIEEVSLKKGESKTFVFKGGGAAGSVGRLIAIPRENLKQYGEKLSSDNLDNLKFAVHEKRVDGAQELIGHLFTREVSLLSSAPKSEDYWLKRGPSDGITAVMVSPSGFSGITGRISVIGWAAIAGGLLLSLAVISLGLWGAIKVFKQNPKQA